MRICIFHCQSVKDKQQNRQKHIFKSNNPCPPKGAAISAYPSGGGSGLRTCSRRLACSIISNSLFPVRRHSNLRSGYSSGTILLLYIYSVPGIPWPPAAQEPQSFLFPRYSHHHIPVKNGIDYSTPFQQRTEKNCRLQQRLTRSAPCLFFRTGRRLDQVAVRILILIYDDIRCSIRSRSCYRQFF